MIHQKAEITPASVRSNTGKTIKRTNDIVQQVVNYLADKKKKDRLEISECKGCYYTNTDRVGVETETRRLCGICNQVQIYSTTSTYPLCISCAQKHRLCRWCAGDVNMHTQRVFSLDGNLTATEG